MLRINIIHDQTTKTKRSAGLGAGEVTGEGAGEGAEQEQEQEQEQKLARAFEELGLIHWVNKYSTWHTCRVCPSVDIQNEDGMGILCGK